MIRSPTWEEVEHEARRFQQQAGRHQGPPPELHNVEAVRWLNSTRVLPWLEREYLVDPIAFEAAAELYQVQLQVAALHQRRRKLQGEAEAGQEVDVQEAQEEAQEELELLRRIVAIFPRLVRPKGRLRALAWRLGLYRNPFRHASAGEVMQLLDFFYSSPTASRVLASRPATFARSRRG